MHRPQHNSARHNQQQVVVRAPQPLYLIPATICCNSFLQQYFCQAHGMLLLHAAAATTAAAAARTAMLSAVAAEAAAWLRTMHAYRTASCCMLHTSAAAAAAAVHVHGSCTCKYSHPSMLMQCCACKPLRVVKGHGTLTTPSLLHKRAPLWSIKHQSTGASN